MPAILSSSSQCVATSLPASSFATSITIVRTGIGTINCSTCIYCGQRWLSYCNECTKTLSEFFCYFKHFLPPLFSLVFNPYRPNPRSYFFANDPTVWIWFTIFHVASAWAISRHRTTLEFGSHLGFSAICTLIYGNRISLDRCHYDSSFRYFICKV